jgi:hypothetical protein
MTLTLDRVGVKCSWTKLSTQVPFFGMAVPCQVSPTVVAQALNVLRQMFAG